MENHSLSDDPLDCAGAQPTSTGASRVLVCLDRSELSETVLSYPVMLARATAGSLTLMNIVESSGDITSESHDALVWELKCNEARQYMGQLLERIGRLDVPVDIQIEEGRAAEQILGFVRQHPVDFSQSSPPAPGHGEQASESLPTAPMTWMQRATPGCSRST
jgi:hypothetical protein